MDDEYELIGTGRANKSGASISFTIPKSLKEHIDPESNGRQLAYFATDESILFARKSEVSTRQFHAGSVVADATFLALGKLASYDSHAMLSGPAALLEHFDVENEGIDVAYFSKNKHYSIVEASSVKLKSGD